MKKNKKHMIIITIVVIALIAIDQISKFLIVGKNINLIPNVLTFNFSEEIAGTFGVGFKGTFTFVITNLIVLGVIFKFMKMQQEQIDTKTYIALIMIIAGAIGNLIDRLFRGYVVKFIILWKLPAFNVADILIVLGWVLLALFFAIFAVKVRKDNNIDKKED